MDNFWQPMMADLGDEDELLEVVEEGDEHSDHDDHDLDLGGEQADADFMSAPEDSDDEPVIHEVSPGHE